MPNGVGNPPLATVVHQRAFDPYGEVIWAEDFAGSVPLKLGHKGLFVDRLDVGVVDIATGDETPRIVPFAHMLLHNRNRVYAPGLGRFMQRDPNDTAMTLLAAATFHGSPAYGAAGGFDLMGMYGDGPNLYQYLGGNPMIRSDPLGLAWDPFSIVDEYLAESAGNSAAFLAAVGQGTRSAAVLAAHIATYLPFPAAAIAGNLALVALGEKSMEDALGEMAVDAIVGGAAGAALRMVGKLSAHVWRFAKAYVAQHGIAGVLSPGYAFGKSLFAKAKKWVRGGCFEAQTEVWTARGMVAIEHIQVGDKVLAVNEETGEVEERTVTKTYRRENAPILEVVVFHFTEGTESELRTTEEHPFWVQGKGWVRADQLRVGDELHAQGGAGVAAVRFAGRMSVVYNLEVDGLHDYRVGPGGVLVHKGLNPF